jgi:hypothetical protein
MGRSIPCGRGALSRLVGGSYVAVISDRDIPDGVTLASGGDADPIALAGIVGRCFAGRGRQGTSFRIGRMGVGIVVWIGRLLSLRC